VYLSIDFANHLSLEDMDPQPYYISWIHDHKSNIRRVLKDEEATLVVLAYDRA
jgi:hypothetical protein